MSLNVAHFVSSLNLGGAERFVLDLSVIQRDNSLTPLVCSLGSPDDALLEEVNNLGISCLTAPKVWGRLKRLQTIVSWLSQNNVDVVHLHSPVVLGFLAPVLPLLRLRHRIIYTRHGCDPLSSFTHRLVHRFANFFVDWATFVSDEGEVVFHANHHWSQNKLRVIENGAFIPDQWKQPTESELTSRVLKFGSVGRMDPIKGQEFLLQAVGMMSEADQTKLALEFFGSGAVEGDLIRTATTKLQATKSRFHGLVLDRNIVFAELDVLVVCSESEGLSLAIMEAMARGIPVVATDVGGNSRLVHHGKTGWLVPYADPKKLAEIMTEIITERALIVEYGGKSRRFISDNFSLIAAHTRYLECYRQNRPLETS